MYHFTFRNADVDYLITTGDGRFFSNGLDKDWLMTNPSKEEYQQFRIGWTNVMLRILAFPMPTIAAINGNHC